MDVPKWSPGLVSCRCYRHNYCLCFVKCNRSNDNCASTATLVTQNFVVHNNVSGSGVLHTKLSLRRRNIGPKLLFSFDKISPPLAGKQEKKKNNTDSKIIELKAGKTCEILHESQQQQQHKSDVRRCEKLNHNGSNNIHCLEGIIFHIGANKTEQSKVTSTRLSRLLSYSWPRARSGLLTLAFGKSRESSSCEGKKNVVEEHCKISCLRQSMVSFIKIQHVKIKRKRRTSNNERNKKKKKHQLLLRQIHAFYTTIIDTTLTTKTLRTTTTTTTTTTNGELNCYGYCHINKSNNIDRKQLDDDDDHYYHYYCDHGANKSDTLGAIRVEQMMTIIIMMMAMMKRMEMLKKDGYMSKMFSEFEIVRQIKRIERILRANDSSVQVYTILLLSLNKIARENGIVIKNLTPTASSKESKRNKMMNLKVRIVKLKFKPLFWFWILRSRRSGRNNKRVVFKMLRHFNSNCFASMQEFTVKTIEQQQREEACDIKSPTLSLLLFLVVGPSLIIAFYESSGGYISVRFCANRKRVAVATKAVEICAAASGCRYCYCMIIQSKRLFKRADALRESKSLMILQKCCLTSLNCNLSKVLRRRNEKKKEERQESSQLTSAKLKLEKVGGYFVFVSNYLGKKKEREKKVKRKKTARCLWRQIQLNLNDLFPLPQNVELCHHLTAPLNRYFQLIERYHISLNSDIISDKRLVHYTLSAFFEFNKPNSYNGRREKLTLLERRTKVKVKVRAKRRSKFDNGRQQERNLVTPANISALADRIETCCVENYHEFIRGKSGRKEICVVDIQWLCLKEKKHFGSLRLITLVFPNHLQSSLLPSLSIGEAREDSSTGLEHFSSGKHSHQSLSVLVSLSILASPYSTLHQSLPSITFSEEEHKLVDCNKPLPRRRRRHDEVNSTCQNSFSLIIHSSYKVITLQLTWSIVLKQDSEELRELNQLIDRFGISLGRMLLEIELGIGGNKLLELLLLLLIAALLSLQLLLFHLFHRILLLPIILIPLLVLLVQFKLPKVPLERTEFIRLCEILLAISKDKLTPMMKQVLRIVCSSNNNHHEDEDLICVGNNADLYSLLSSFEIVQTINATHINELTMRSYDYICIDFARKLEQCNNIRLGRSEEGDNNNMRRREEKKSDDESEIVEDLKLCCCYCCFWNRNNDTTRFNRKVIVNNENKVGYLSWFVVVVVVVGGAHQLAKQATLVVAAYEKSNSYLTSDTPKIRREIIIVTVIRLAKGIALMLPEVTAVRETLTKIAPVSAQNGQCLANLRVVVTSLKAACLNRTSGCNITMKAHYLCFRCCHYGCCCCCFCYQSNSELLLLLLCGSSNGCDSCTARRRKKQQQQPMEQTLPSLSTLENQSASSSVATQSKLITKGSPFYCLSNAKGGGFYRKREKRQCSEMEELEKEKEEKGSNFEQVRVVAGSNGSAEKVSGSACRELWWQKQADQRQERATCKPRPSTVLSSDCTNCFIRGNAGRMLATRTRRIRIKMKMFMLMLMVMRKRKKRKRKRKKGRKQHHMKRSEKPNSSLLCSNSASSTTSSKSNFKSSKSSLEWFMTLFAILLCISSAFFTTQATTQVVANVSGGPNRSTSKANLARDKVEKMQRHSGRSIIGGGGEFLSKVSSIKRARFSGASSLQVSGFDQLDDDDNYNNNNNNNNKNEHEMLFLSKWNSKREEPSYSHSRDKPVAAKWSNHLSRNRKQHVVAVETTRKPSRELNDNDDDHSDDNNDNGQGNTNRYRHEHRDRNSNSNGYNSTTTKLQLYDSNEASLKENFVLPEKLGISDDQHEALLRKEGEGEDKINIFSTKVTKEAFSRALASLSPVRSYSRPSIASSFTLSSAATFNNQSDKTDLNLEFELKELLRRGDADRFQTSIIGSQPSSTATKPSNSVPASLTESDKEEEKAGPEDSGHEKDGQGKDRLTSSSSSEESSPIRKAGVLIGSQEHNKIGIDQTQPGKRDSEFVSSNCPTSSYPEAKKNLSLRSSNQNKRQKRLLEASQQHRSSLILNELSRLQQQQQQQQQQQKRRPTITTVPNSSPFPYKSINGQCHENCLCVWKNGKQFADCSNSKLSQIPGSLDPLLQVLNFSYNYLPELQNSAFVSLKLNNLQRIYMSNCQMKKIQARAFENLKLVVELDFSWNKLKFVPLPQIRQLSLLRRLTMRGNPLYSLDEISLSGGINNIKTSKNDLDDDETTSRGNNGGGNKVSDGEKSSTFDNNSNNNNVTLEKNLARFYETYPKLAKALVRLKLRLRRGGSNNFAIENSTIIKSRNSSAKSATNGNFLDYKSSNDEFLEQSLFEDSREFEILQALIERRADDTMTTKATSLLDKIVPNGAVDEGETVAEEEEEEAEAEPDEQLEVSPGYEHTQLLDDNSNNNGVEKVQPYSSTINTEEKQTFGAYFSQLQELDFGQCKLSYIKWTSLSHLNQLKRLLLDGNYLSQLSGRLIEVLPRGLHQLSLEENPWKCDCRLLALKRWLLTTRTPLRAPVRCQSTSLMSSAQANTIETSNFKETPIKSHLHSSAMPATYNTNLQQQQQLDQTIHNSETNSFQQARSENSFFKAPISPFMSISSDIMSSKLQQNLYFFDQLTEEDFVCAPKALNIQQQHQPIGDDFDIKSSSPPSGSQAVKQEISLEKLGELAHATNLKEIYEYLEPTLIQVPTKGLDLGANQMVDFVEIEAPTQQTATANKVDSSINVNLNSPNEFSSSSQVLPAYSTLRSLAWSTPSSNSPQAHFKEGGVTIATSNNLKVQQKKDVLQANEDESITLRCAFFASPESSVDIIWLASYNHHPELSMQQQQQHSRQQSKINQFQSKALHQALGGKLPAEERFVVLYDSKLHRQNNNNNNLISSSSDQSTSFGLSNNAVNLYNSRISISETYAKLPNRDDSLFVYKESLFKIQSVLSDDSARYKCIALNKAGNASFEYLLRVSGSSTKEMSTQQLASSLLTNGVSRDTTHLTSSNEIGNERDREAAASSPGSFQHHLRDQRAQQKQQVLVQQQQQQQQTTTISQEEQANNRRNSNRSHMAQSSNQQATTQTQLVPSSTWLKSSTTFQVTIVVVSFLMAAVIIAFLLICIIIYQIKPSSAQTILLASGSPPGGSNSGGGIFSSMVFAGRLKGISDASNLATGSQTRSYLASSQPDQTSRFISRDDNYQESLLMNETPFFLANVHQPVPLLATLNNPITGTSPVHLLATDQNRSIQTIPRQQQQIQTNIFRASSPMQTIDQTMRDGGFALRPQNYQQAHQLQPRIELPATSISYAPNSIQQFDQQHQLNQQRFAN